MVENPEQGALRVSLPKFRQIVVLSITASSSAEIDLRDVGLAGKWCNIKVEGGQVGVFCLTAAQASGSAQDPDLTATTGDGRCGTVDPGQPPEPFYGSANFPIVRLTADSSGAVVRISDTEL